MIDRDYTQFIDKFKQTTGVDLSLYKETQMKRRLTSLRNKHGFHSFLSYYEAMRENRDLYYEFLDRITINVSEFFRNSNRWKVLSDKIVPALLSRKKKLKVWSAACSTGEEPYSLVTMLTKFMPLSQIQVLATDIDDKVLEKAKEGIYPERVLKECSRSFINQYFEKKAGLYHISEDVKQRVIFRKHNLLSDTFEKDFDLIVCRNVMIYFTEKAKNQLYKNFTQSLSAGGILFVGSTEQIFNTKKYGLEVVDTFFYRKSE